MFWSLLLVNLVEAFVICGIVAFLFKKPVSRIMQRLVTDDIYTAWTKYITFAIFVVGISGGVRIWDLEKYINPSGKDNIILELTKDRWMLEVFHTVIATLQSIAWMMLVFFLFALIAYVIVRGFEMKKHA
ncbi:MAG: hypothetical protein NTW14_00430 [bacterium]|nr:hypothetical protein [bacterium]